MNLESLYNQTAEFIQKNNLNEISDTLKNEIKVTPIEDIQKILQEYESNKPLQIGIVGRVKAGKSSLLNAILFEGKDILPKAATPMTAALTMIEYSESVQAELEFFTEKDFTELEEKYHLYIFNMKERVKDEFEKLRGMIRNKLKTDQQLQEQAIRIAEAKMKDSPYAASYDQYYRIKESGISLSQLENISVLTADNIKELTHGKLNDFVGANGKYMPFTKSVTLKIPDPNLKDLRIVDTPGINDPVQSRGARTEAMLGQCDVILLVSPSGQFLSKEDMELMQRIVSKDGIQEIYLISSQADTQLYGSERQKLSDPNLILNNISQSLTEHAQKTLQQAATDIQSSIGGQEVSDIYQTASKNPVICTSGIAYSIWQRFEQQDDWDKNMLFTWNKLQESFPGHFNNPEIAKITLEKLANIKTIKNIIADLKPKKAGIQNKKALDYKRYQAKNFLSYLAELSTHLHNKVEKLKSSDLQELQQEQDFIKEQAAETESAISSSYSDLVEDFDYELPQKLRQKLNQIIQAFESQSDNARGTEIETYRRSTGKSWWQVWKNKYEDAQRTVETINAGAVRRAIQGTRQEITDELNDLCKEFRKQWKKKLQSCIFSAVRGENNQHDGKIKERDIRETLRLVLSKIKDHEFILRQSLPSNIDKTGTLKGSEAEKFFDAVQDYAYDLKRSISEEIKQYCNETVRELQALNIAENFTKTLQNQLNDLIKAVESREESLRNYDQMLNDLKVLQEKSNEI